MGGTARRPRQKELFLWDCSKIVTGPNTESESFTASWCICRTTVMLWGPPSYQRCLNGAPPYSPSCMGGVPYMCTSWISHLCIDLRYSGPFTNPTSRTDEACNFIQKKPLNTESEMKFPFPVCTYRSDQTPKGRSIGFVSIVYVVLVRS